MLNTLNPGAFQLVQSRKDEAASVTREEWANSQLFTSSYIISRNELELLKCQSSHT